MAIISGNAHPKLAQDIAKVLHLPLTKAHVSRFSDGEFNIEILENIRGRDTYIIQSTSPPSAENLMELLVMADACKRASANQITAKLVAKLIAASGIDRVLTVDLHAEQIQGFFDVAVDNVYASPILLGDAWKNDLSDIVVVSPDVGGVVRGRALAKRLDNADLVIIDKRRSKANKSEVMNIIGDVENKNCIMIDDMVDTAGTLCHAADKLKECGAASVRAYITHPVLSGPAVQRITDSAIDELVVTDTIPLSEAATLCSKIRQLSTAELLGETMRRISEEESVSSLYLE